MTDEQVMADTQAWLHRVVIGLNLCPFAKAVVVKNQLRLVVCQAAEPTAVLAMLQAELRHLADTDPALLDTTLLIAPCLLPDFVDFNAFLFDCDALLETMGLAGVLQIADFHPRYQFAGVDPSDISNHTNRAPYPTLHLLREVSVDKAVAAFPNAASIYDTNIATMQALGHTGWAALNLPMPKP